jgi:Lar family restriction alleviation protein
VWEGFLLNKLKPCPFCGREATFHIRKYRGDIFEAKIDFFIACRYCSCRTGGDYRIDVKLLKNGELLVSNDDREIAINAWNRRAGE